MTITGTIESVRCYKQDTGWAAIRVLTAGGTPVNVTGVMPGIRLGMNAQFTGEVAESRFGPTFKASSFMETLPSDSEGIEKYLASGLIKNIGPVLAHQIVGTFGEKTLDVLDNDPERLKEVYGIGPKRIGSIIETVKEHREVRTIMVWLKRYDLSNGLAARIYQTYGNAAVRLLEENPYRLSDDIRGIAFKRADDVARRLGLPPQSPFRIRSGILACLEDAATEGNTYVDIDRLVRETASEKYLSLAPDPVRAQLLDPAFSKVVIDGPDVFLPVYYHAERRIAQAVADFSGQMDDSAMPDFRRIEASTGFRYSDEQRSAVMMALWTDFLVVTGGPGTGKTATTNAIINELEHRSMHVELAAPTGRAAKRMSEVTHRPARTIHRLLEYSQGEFTRNESNPIEADALVVDESSMIDTLLMKSLLSAVRPGTKVILVGDVDQLPSVGAGSVLRDIIDSERAVTIRLTQIFRQAQGSDIVMNAHRVNRGLMPRTDNHPGTDFWLVREEDRDRVADIVVDLVSRHIPSAFGIPTKDIQVLSPMRRPGDAIASTDLNVRLQAAVNPGGSVAARKGETEFRVGDRVMQVKNNYDKDIYNGDIGTVTAGLSGNDEDHAVLLADFDGMPVRFTQGELNELELSYACTVHKSQGSEYPVVVMPVHNNHFVMLKRNLLYTGITRAKKQCIVVGMEDAIQNAVRREDTVRRNTRLQERIRQAWKSDNTERTTLF